MTGRDIGFRVRPDRFTRLAVVLAMIAALVIVASPAQAAPGVTIAESDGTTDVTEGGATDTYTVVLDELPSDTVTVTVSPDAQVSVDETLLTFTVGDWNIAQTVTVTAVNDDVAEGPHTGTVTHSAAGGGYGAVVIADVDAAVTDNDTASVSIVESDGSTSVTEGGASDSYTVVLTSEPTSSVTVTVTDDAQVTVDKPTLTFTTGDWDTEQTVTVSAVDDDVVEPTHSGTVTHSAAGGGYGAVVVDDVVASVADNDTASVSIVESGGSTSVTEGGTTDSYTVVLTSDPTSSVTVTVTDDAQVSVDKPTLTFTKGNWDSAQTVTVTAVNDDVAEGPHSGTVTHSAAGGGYGAVGIVDVVASVTDNEIAGVTITPVDPAGAEFPSNTGSYTVVLTSEPTSTVTVTVTDDAQVSVDKPTLTFTTGNWDSAQTVTVTPINDSVVEGTHPGVVSHSASGGGYGAVVIDDYTISIADNDFAVAFLEPSSSAFEGTGAPSPRVVFVELDTNGRTLTSSVSVEVAVRLGGSATPGVDFTFTSPTTVTFLPGDTDGTTRSVIVTVIGDALNELTESVVLDLQNPSTGGSIVGPSAHTVEIVNDDVAPGISVLDAVAVAEGPAAALTFRVVLSPASGQTVTVRYATANGTAVAPGDYTAVPVPQTLTFSPGGPLFQDVVVPVANDTLDEITETVLLNLTDPTNTTLADAQGVGMILDDDNVAPVVSSLATTDLTGTPRFTFAAGETVKVSGAFTDPGLADVHTVTVDWGDGTTPGVFPVAPAGGRIFEETHVYAAENLFKISVSVGDADGGSGTDEAFVSVTGTAVGPGGPSVGLVDPATGIWRLYNSDGVIDTQFYYGVPGDYPFMGDWDGDGIETPGLYRQSDGFVYLRNTNTQGAANRTFFFGNPGDVPIAGDFNGDGFDTVSIYRPSNQTFYIINALGKDGGGLGAAEVAYVFGDPGDKPFIGDFNGDDVETVGLHRESTGLVYYRNTHTTGNAHNQFIFGDPGDRLVADDWNDNGVSTPALYRPSNTTMYYRYSNTQGNANHQWTAGNSTWLPVSGVTGF